MGIYCERGITAKWVNIPLLDFFILEFISSIVMVKACTLKIKRLNYVHKFTY